MKSSVPWLLLGGLAFAQSPAKPALQEFRLPNGLRVLLLEDHATPLVRATLRLAWDPEEEPAEKPGLGTFLGLLLEASAASLPRSSGDPALGAAGVRLQFRPSVNRLSWAVSAASSEQEAALRTLAQHVQRPALDGPAIEALRLNQWRQLEAQPPLQPLRSAFTLALARHRTFDLEALSRLGLNDLEAFYRHLCRPERAVLGLSGDLSLAQAKALALLHLGAWGRSSEPHPLSHHPTRRLSHHPEGAPEAWLGIPALGATPKDRACSEWVRRILRSGAAESRPFEGLVLEQVSAPDAEQLLGLVQNTLARWEDLTEGWTEARYKAVQAQWRQEEALLLLHPSRALDRAMDRSLGVSPPLEDLEALSLVELKQGFRRALDQAHLLVSGLPQATLRKWLQEEPALSRWKDQMEMPKRDAKSK